MPKEKVKKMKLLKLIPLLLFGCNRPHYQCDGYYQMKCWSMTCPCTCSATDPRSYKVDCNWVKPDDFNYDPYYNASKPLPSPDYDFKPFCLTDPIDYAKDPHYKDNLELYEK